MPEVIIIFPNKFTSTLDYGGGVAAAAIKQPIWSRFFLHGLCKCGSVKNQLKVVKTSSNNLSRYQVFCIFHEKKSDLSD